MGGQGSNLLLKPRIGQLQLVQLELPRGVVARLHRFEQVCVDLAGRRRDDGEGDGVRDKEVPNLGTAQKRVGSVAGVEVAGDGQCLAPLPLELVRELHGHSLFRLLQSLGKGRRAVRADQLVQRSTHKLVRGIAYRLETRCRDKEIEAVGRDARPKLIGSKVARSQNRLQREIHLWADTPAENDTAASLGRVCMQLSDRLHPSILAIGTTGAECQSERRVCGVDRLLHLTHDRHDIVWMAQLGDGMSHQIFVVVAKEPRRAGRGVQDDALQGKDVDELVGVFNQKLTPVALTIFIAGLSEDTLEQVYRALVWRVVGNSLEALVDPYCR